jgi:hypothetical protein
VRGDDARRELKISRRMENEEMSDVMLRSPFSILHSSFIDIE